MMDRALVYYRAGVELDLVFHTDLQGKKCAPIFVIR